MTWIIIFSAFWNNLISITHEQHHAMSTLPSLPFKVHFSRTIMHPFFILIAALGCSPFPRLQASDDCEPAAIVWESQPHPSVESTKTRSDSISLTDGITLHLNVEDQDVRVTLQNIAETCKRKVLIPDDLKWQTSVNLTNTTWQQAFDILLHQRGYSWTIVDEVIRIYKKPSEPVDPRIQMLPSGKLKVEFRNTRVITILSSIAQAIDLNLVIPPDPNLNGELDIRLTEVDWKQIFQVALSQFGFGYLIEHDIVIVCSLEQIRNAPEESWGFRMKHLDTQAIGMLLTEISGIKKVDVDTTANVVTVTGPPSRLQTIKAIIDKLDRPPHPAN
jgi:type II secretory pathway component GspD/PulD (secretin)